jgi:hypothetical protein
MSTTTARIFRRSPRVTGSAGGIEANGISRGV